MAQEQPSAPDYPYPDGVTIEWRNATTPPPQGDLFEDGVLQIDPVTGVLYKRVFAHRMVHRRVYTCNCHLKSRPPPHRELNPEKFAIELNAPRGENSLINCISRGMYEPAIRDASYPPCPQCRRDDAQLTGSFKKFYYLPEVFTVNVAYITGGKADFEQGWVDLPQTLDLSNLCDRDEDKALSKYTLRAVVLWIGSQRANGSTSGHYISYVRRGMDDNWVFLDDNKQYFSPNRRQMLNGEQIVEKVRLADITARIGPGARKHRPRLLFYTRDRPDSSNDDDDDGEGIRRQEAQEAAEQRATEAQEARDNGALQQIATDRATRRTNAESHANKPINVRLRPTRHRGATQGEAPQPQGRCNCGGPRAQAGRGGSHQETPQGSRTVERRSGEGSSTRTAGRASMRGGAGEEELEDYEEEEQEVAGGEEQAEGGDAGANDNGGSSDASDVTVNWPRAPEAQQTDAPEDLENAATWPYERFRVAFKNVFGKNPPGRRPRVDEGGIEPDRGTNAANLIDHFDRTKPQNWEAAALQTLKAATAERLEKLEAAAEKAGQSTEGLKDRMPKGGKCLPYVRWLTADDQVIHAAELRGAQAQRRRDQEPQQRSGAEDEEEVQRSSAREDEEEEEEGPPPPAGDQEEGGQPPPADDEADEELVRGITQLEELIERLERRACGCLNGQTSLPVNGMRNGRGTPHRALQVRVTIPRQGQDNHRQTYWIPLATELGNMPDMLLSGRVYVNRPSGDTPTRVVRIELSGPEDPPADPDTSIGSARATVPEFMNWIEFEVDFELDANDVNIEAWQDDMPAVPFISVREPSSSEQRRRDTRGGGGGGGGGGDHNDDDDDDDGGGDNGDGQGDRGDGDKEAPPPSGGEPHGGIPKNPPGTRPPGTEAPTGGGNETREALGDNTGDPPGTKTADDSTTIEEIDLSELLKLTEKTGNTPTQSQSGTGTANDSSIEEITIDVGTTTATATAGTQAGLDPNQPGVDEDSWFAYEQSLLDQPATATGGHKRTAEAAGIDDGGDGQGGDTSRKRVGGHNNPHGGPPPPPPPPPDDTPPDDSSSLDFSGLGATDMSTPKQKADRRGIKDVTRSVGKMSIQSNSS
ncbi:hypothetical protein INS49_010000 [Diaporthe citri]|uniref:uncharacterized protein n=1 Tax=Diaporthe citri TaxID=83186 RepID=UPI001C8062ED|nr:uncharacterized protein INS49_010000 [Diaporthe citri]KAG6361772.1 hypothetical protein INS49_010000 [Diaporthe citri]